MRARRVRALGAAAVAALAVSGCQYLDVSFLAADATGGRDNGTAGSAASREYLLDQLSPLAQGLLPGQTGDAAYLQPFSGGTNVLAVLPGTDLADEYVLVGAHYDHVGSNCDQQLPGDTICNGATDNAAGVSAALEIARQLHAAPTPTRRSVIIALWDREEDGLLGSAAFVANPPVPLDAIVAGVNFDIQGARILPSLAGDTFAVGAESGGPGLAGVVAQAATIRPGIELHPLSAIFGQNRSDYVNFIDAGVPTVFFTDSTGPCYHTAQDDRDVVDFVKLARQTDVASAVVRSLADTDSPPTIVTGGPLATFADAVELLEVVQRAEPDLGRFTPAQQATLTTFRSSLQAIVAGGAGAFDNTDVATVLAGAAQAVGILASGTCDGFLDG